MTREQFITKAIRTAERLLLVPPGWWGTWADRRGPNGARVTIAQAGSYVAWRRGKKIGAYDTRATAIKHATSGRP